jgi:hypothetical protein
MRRPKSWSTSLKRHGDVLLGAKPEGRNAYKKAYDDLQRQIADLSAMRKAQTHMSVGKKYFGASPEMLTPAQTTTQINKPSVMTWPWSQGWEGQEESSLCPQEPIRAGLQSRHLGN